MQQQPETPVTPPPTPQLNPGLPPNYPPKKSKLWLWIALAVVGVLVTAGIVITIIIVSNNSTSPADTTTSRQRAIKPDKKSNDNDDIEDEEEQQDSATAATKCLTSADFRRSGYTHVKNGYFVLENGRFNFRSIFFKPDSTQYQYETSNVEIAKLGMLYKFNADKQFSIELVGQTYEPSKTSEGSRLALERANRVKRELVSKGIPENKITISEPTVANHDNSDDTADRNVTIYIIAPQKCSEK